METGQFSSWLVFSAVLVLAVGSLVMLSLRFTQPKFGYQWLIALVSAATAWPLVLLAKQGLPQTFQLLRWEPETLFRSSPVLLLDPVSWSFGLVLVSLSLAVILTSVTNLPYVDWRAWVGTLALTALGLMAVLAGNPLTLLLAWAALDLVEVLILLGQAREDRIRQQAILVFSARLAGIAVMLWAIIEAHSQNMDLTFAAIPAQVSPYLLVAAGLRLGVLPIQVPLLGVITERRGIGTTMRLVPVAASFVLLVRTAVTGVSGIPGLVLSLLAALSAVSSGISWATSSDELEGRPYWILGMASLAVASAIAGQPEASLAWGVAGILSGALLFLAAIRHRYLLPLLLLGYLGFSTLPFTPAWDGAGLFAGMPEVQPLPLRLFLAALFFLALFFYLVGYLRHGLRFPENFPGQERWLWLVYPAGLVVLPLAHFLIGWINRPALIAAPLVTWGAGLLVQVPVIIYALWRLRERLLRQFRSRLRAGASWSSTAWGRILSLQWLYGIASWLYHSLGRGLGLLNIILEGEGGILWALFLLMMLFSLSLQIGLGR